MNMLYIPGKVLCTMYSRRHSPMACPRFADHETPRAFEAPLDDDDICRFLTLGTHGPLRGGLMQ